MLAIRLFYIVNNKLAGFEPCSSIFRNGYFANFATTAALNAMFAGVKIWPVHLGEYSWLVNL